MEPVEEITVETASGTVALSRREASGTAVVLLHGAATSHHAWAPLFDASDARLIAPSRPGRAGSTSPAPNDVADMATWLEHLLDALEIEAAVFVGHSLGGALAIELALQRPDRVAGLLLVATGARLRVHPMILALYADAAKRGKAVDTPKFVWRPDTPASVRDAWVAAGRLVEPAAAHLDWQIVDAFDRMADVGAIGAPTVVVGGDADQLTPLKYARYLADGVPGGRLVEVPGGGHMLPVERPEVVAEVLASLLP